jgi:hypothetical protein
MANKKTTDQDDAPAGRTPKKRKRDLEFHMEVSYVPLPPEKELGFHLAMDRLMVAVMGASEKKKIDSDAS